MASARNCIPFPAPEPPITQADIIELLMVRELVTQKERELKTRLAKRAPLTEGLHHLRLVGDSLLAD